MRILLTLLLCSLGVYAQEAKQLPRLFIVGDSISLAYTPLVQKELAGRMQVERAPGNCRYSSWGAEHAGEWVKDKHWDVIHFNFGLWDLYGWKQDELISVEDYGKNIEAIVLHLKPACDVLVFGTTTPPCAEAEHKIKVLVTQEKADAFEAEARRVMRKHHVLVNDLDSVLAESMDKHGKAPNDVHFLASGNQLLAKKVAAFAEMANAAGARTK